MDLGIRGRKAIICASSQGLGKACARALAEAGAAVVINGRHREILERAAQEIREATGSEVTAVTGDVSTRQGTGRAARGVPGAGYPRQQQQRTAVSRFSRVGPRGSAERRYHEHGDADRAHSARHRWDDGTPIRQNREHHLGQRQDAARRIGFVERRPSGITAFVAGIARSVADKNVTINNLLPGSFETARLDAIFLAGAKRRGVSASDIASQARHAIPAKRFGAPAELGQTCAFLCSVHAGTSPVRTFCSMAANIPRPSEGLRLPLP